MRTIDADALMDIYANRMDLLVERYGIDSTACGTLSGAMKLLKMQHTIKPERKRGRWIAQEFGSCAECSECHELYNIPMAYSNFCPNCGSDMRIERREE